MVGGVRGASSLLARRPALGRRRESCPSTSRGNDSLPSVSKALPSVSKEDVALMGEGVTVVVAWCLRGGDLFLAGTIRASTLVLPDGSMGAAGKRMLWAFRSSFHRSVSEMGSFGEV